MSAMTDHLPVDEYPGVVATPLRLHAWAAAARPGEVFVYATRSTLPLGSAGATYVRQLAARGLVTLTQKRVSRDRPGVPGAHNYRATRTSVPWPVAAKQARAVLTPAGEPDLVAEVEQLAVDQLLPVLSRAAQFRRPCPTNKALADRVGCSVDLAAAGVAALRSLRLIHVASAPPPTDRFVTILATGWRTGVAA